MIHLLIWIIALLLAFLTIFFRMIDFIKSEKNSITIGSWQAVNFMNLQSSALQRAVWSVFGIMNVKKEILYFIATKDQNGQILDGRKHYTLTGTNLDARFWSVSIYNKKGQLIKNENNQYSLSNQQTILDRNNNFIIDIGPHKQGQNWLLTGNASTIQLLIRLYQPSPETFQTIKNIQLPTIQRD